MSKSRFSNFMDLIKSVEFWTKVAGVCAVITLVILIYDRYIKPIIYPVPSPTYLESLSVTASELAGKNTVGFSDSLSNNEEVRRIVALQDQKKSTASEFLSSVAKRKELAGMEVGPELVSALERDVKETTRPLYLLKETMTSINLVSQDLETSTSKWKEAINQATLDEISEALNTAREEQYKCDSIIVSLLNSPNRSNRDIKNAVKTYESLYENEKFMGFYEKLFEWYNKLFDQLNGRILEIKNEQ